MKCPACSHPNYTSGGYQNGGSIPAAAGLKLRWHVSRSAFGMNPRPSDIAHLRSSSPTLNTISTLSMWKFYVLLLFKTWKISTCISGFFCANITYEMFNETARKIIKLLGLLKIFMVWRRTLQVMHAFILIMPTWKCSEVKILNNRGVNIARINFPKQADTFFYFTQRNDLPFKQNLCSQKSWMQ